MMNLLANIKGLIMDLRKTSDRTKIVVIAIVVVICTIVMGYFWVKDAASSVSQIGQAVKSQQLPNLDLPDTSNVLPAQPSTIDTSSWKTYTNTDYGFEIKYPNNWYTGDVLRSDNSRDIYISSVNPNHDMTRADFTAEALDINVSSIKAGDTLSQELKNKFGKEGADFTKKDIIIGSVNGFVITTICQGVGCGAPEWIFIKNNYFYHITSGLDSTNQRIIFDQIISTFKFTNTTK